MLPCSVCVLAVPLLGMSYRQAGCIGLSVAGIAYLVFVVSLLRRGQPEHWTATESTGTHREQVRPENLHVCARRGTPRQWYPGCGGVARSGYRYRLHHGQYRRDQRDQLLTADEYGSRSRPGHPGHLWKPSERDLVALVQRGSVDVGLHRTLVHAGAEADAYQEGRAREAGTQGQGKICCQQFWRVKERPAGEAGRPGDHRIRPRPDGSMIVTTNGPRARRSAGPG